MNKRTLGLFRGAEAYLSNLLLAMVFLAVWLKPGILGSQSVFYLASLILIEFIAIHSSILLICALTSQTPGPSRMRRIVALVVTYSLFAAFATMAFHSMWLFAAFWLLHLNKLGIYVTGRGEPELTEEKALSRWGVELVAYLVLAFAVTIVPLPQLGMANHLGVCSPGGEAEIWHKEPFRIIALGFAYFATMAIHGFATAHKIGVPADEAPLGADVQNHP